MPRSTTKCILVLLAMVIVISSGQRTTRRTVTTNSPRTKPPRLTTTKPPEKVTKPFNCSLEHRNHPTSESMFQKKWNSVWRNYTCPVAGLIWNQETCRCEQGGDNQDPCADYTAVSGSPKKYIRTVWGKNYTLSCGYGMVWSQEECTCRFAMPGEIASAGAASDPCEIMLNATFDEGLKDIARGSYIGRYPWSGAKVEKTSGAVGGGAVCLKKGYITVPAFMGNELSRTFHIQFRVRLDPEKESDPMNRFDVLVSNGCSRDNPTVALGYRRSDRSFVVGITDMSDSISLTCSDRGSSNGWKEISLEVINQRVVLTVNGRVCLEENNSVLTDQPIPTRCPLSFGGDARSVAKTMTGCFDEVVVRRFCVG